MFIDASTAHRVDPAWTFGLPELAKEQRAKIRASKRIANPGCHATAFILALRPLVEAGLLPAATQIAANSITGFSGGDGISTKTQLLKLEEIAYK